MNETSDETSVLFSNFKHVFQLLWLPYVLGEKVVD